MRSAGRWQLALAAILVLAIGVRCLYVSTNTRVVDQSAIQGLIAHNILRGHWFVTGAQEGIDMEAVQRRLHHLPDPADVRFSANADADQKPIIAEVVGPGLVLAAVWEVTGSERFIYAKVLQLAIDLGVLLLVYRIVMLLFRRRRAALIAAALYAVCFPIARQSAIVDPDIWALYFTIATIALYLEAMRSPNRRPWLLACGVTVGVGAYFRVNVLLLPLVLGFASLGWPAMTRPLRAALAISAVAVVLIAPWTIRNYVDFHRFIPMRTGFGASLWEGLGEIHNNFGAIEDDVAVAAQVHRLRPDLEAYTPAFDDFIRRRALHVVAQHPLFYAKTVARRMLLSTAAMYESAWMYGHGESPVRYHARTGKGLLSYALHRPFYLLQSIFEPAIFAFAMLGLALTWRNRRREHLLLIAAILSALIPYWMLHFETRYALPTLPLYLIWIALGAEELGERVASRINMRKDMREAFV